MLDLWPASGTGEHTQGVHIEKQAGLTRTPKARSSASQPGQAIAEAGGDGVGGAGTCLRWAGTLDEGIRMGQLFQT